MTSECVGTFKNDVVIIEVEERKPPHTAAPTLKVWGGGWNLLFPPPTSIFPDELGYKQRTREASLVQFV